MNITQVQHNYITGQCLKVINNQVHTISSHYQYLLRLIFGIIFIVHMGFIELHTVTFISFIYITVEKRWISPLCSLYHYLSIYASMEPVVYSIGSRYPLQFPYIIIIKLYSNFQYFISYIWKIAAYTSLFIFGRKWRIRTAEFVKMLRTWKKFCHFPSSVEPPVQREMASYMTCLAFFIQ